MSYGEVTYAGEAAYAGIGAAAAPAGTGPIEFHLYDPSNSNFIAVLDDTRARRWLDPLNDAGSGSFDIHADHPVVVEHLTDASGNAVYGNVVRCLLDGVVRFAWVIQENGQPTATAAEEAGKVLTISGPGTLGLFQSAVVYPERGPQTNSPDTRVFDWTSQDYKDTDVSWENATQLKRWDALVVGNSWSHYGDQSLPPNFPDPTAYWISGPNGQTTVNADPGYIFFRKSFVLPAAVDGILVYTADDNVDLYIDNAFIEHKNTWTQAARKDLLLDAGPHTIACKVRNVPPISGILNITGLLLSLHSRADTGTSDIGPVILHTDSSWRVDEYPVLGPHGMSPGEVLRILFTEAQARGALPGITWTFTDDLTSTGSGWQAVPDFGIAVGTTYYAMLRQLAELALDFRMDPTSLRIDAVNHQGASQPVTLTVGDNITDAKHAGTGDISNAVLTRTAREWGETLAAGSISTHGRRETFLSLGTSPSSTQSTLATAALFAEQAQPRDALQVTHEGRAGSGEAPYTDYDVGDEITVPTRGLGTSEQRVLAITVTEDDEGYPIFVPEISSPAEQQADRFQRWLKRMALGTVAGQSENASPFMPEQFSLTSTLPPEALVPSAGLRPATKVVAASNSLDTTGADYICTGTDDQDTIIAAIDALPNGTGPFDPDLKGGRVLLLEGDYFLSGTIIPSTLPWRTHLTLEGQGMATRLQLTSDINGGADPVLKLLVQGEVRVANFQLFGNGFAAEMGIVPTGDINWIENVVVQDLDVGMISLNAAFSYGGGGHTTMVGCHAIDIIGAGFAGQGDGCVFLGCRAETCDTYGFTLGGSEERMIGCHARFCDLGAVLVGNTSEAQIIGCWLQSPGPAVLIDQATEVLISNCLLHTTDAAHTVQLDSGEHLAILNNEIRSNKMTGGSHDLINVNGDTATSIRGNRLYVVSGATQPRTGIRIEASSDKTTVLGNVFYNVTTPINNLGTNTQLAYSGGALGDNLSHS